MTNKDDERMPYEDAEEFYWWHKFKKRDELERILVELTREYGDKEGRQVLVRLIESVAVGMFPRCRNLNGSHVHLSVAGQLKDWWKERKKKHE